jgi:hypothetical protein
LVCTGQSGCNPLAQVRHSNSIKKFAALDPLVRCAAEFGAPILT